MGYPIQRLRRLRQNKNIRRLVTETRLSVEQLVMPYFVRTGKGIKKPIASLPGQFQYSIDELLKELKNVQKLNILAILLFGIPEIKDELARSAYSLTGIIQQAVRAIKDKFPELLVITDVCLCAYFDHGHCGVVKNRKIDNDTTLNILGDVAVSHVEAGADIVAPSAMMDGQVAAIRAVLDSSGFVDLPIMAYSAKYASNFYGPFREAAESPPKFGDRKSYQMNFANNREALREIALDIEEGADIVMVKPALAYLDIICQAREKFSLPIAAYNVSGEYALVKAAGKTGWLDEKSIILEILTAIKRAGADIIISYHAVEVVAEIMRDRQR